MRDETATSSKSVLGAMWSRQRKHGRITDWVCALAMLGWFFVSGFTLAGNIPAALGWPVSGLLFVVMLASITILVLKRAGGALLRADNGEHGLTLEKGFGPFRLLIERAELLPLKSPATQHALFVPIDDPHVPPEGKEFLQVRVREAGAAEDDGYDVLLTLAVKTGLTDDAWSAIEASINSLRTGERISTRSLKAIGTRAARLGRKHAGEHLASAFESKSGWCKNEYRATRYIMLSHGALGYILAGVVFIALLTLVFATGLGNLNTYVILVIIGPPVMIAWHVGDKWLNALFKASGANMRIEQGTPMIEWKHPLVTRRVLASSDTPWIVKPFMHQAAPMIELRFRGVGGSGHLGFTDASSLSEEECMLALNRLVEDARASSEPIAVETWLEQEFKQLRDSFADDGRNESAS